MLFYLKAIEHEGEYKPGVLIPLGGEPLASFKCSFAGSVEIRGGGLIGTITSPEEGVPSGTMTISFASVEPESGVQTHRTVANDEADYHLEASFNAGAFEEASEEAEAAITFAKGMEPELRTTE